MITLLKPEVCIIYTLYPNSCILNLMMPKYLSKSNFMHYLIHPGYLWIEKHEKKRLPAITEADQFMFAKGHAFEAEARKLFPQGVMVEGKPWEFAQLTAQTKKLMGDEAVETIFQATTLTERGLLARSDILKRNGEEWNLYEVKSSTRVKDDHIIDLGFQMVAWEEAGVKIGNIYVCYVDREYTREGDIDPHQLVKQETVTASVRKQRRFVTDEIEKALVTMDLPDRPDLDPKYASSLYVWLPIYLHLHPNLPDDHPYRLAQIKPEDIDSLNGEGASSLGTIDNIERFNARQQSQIQAWKHAPKNDHQKIGEFLDSLQFPLWFLDYETISHAVPLYEDTSPYQNIPFQYSLHKLDKPGGTLTHYEHLATDRSFPVPKLIEQLHDEIGDEGSILVWYENFEKSINKEMAGFEPSYQEWVENINQRVVDLMIPFAHGWYVDKHFGGSASLKNVLPVLAPHQSYKELGVQDGGSAQAVWYKYVFDKGELPEKVKKDLLAYCKLDTLAMVEIYQFLAELIESGETYTKPLSQGSLFEL